MPLCGEALACCRGVLFVEREAYTAWLECEDDGGVMKMLGSDEVECECE